MKCEITSCIFVVTYVILNGLNLDIFKSLNEHQKRKRTFMKQLFTKSSAKYFHIRHKFLKIETSLDLKHRIHLVEFLSINLHQRL